jgi:hypothetical protein
MRHVRPHWRARTCAPPRATWPAAARAPNGGRARMRPKAAGRARPWGVHGRGPARPRAPTAEGRLRAWAPSGVRAPRPCAATAHAPHDPTRPHAPHGRRAPMFAPPVRAPEAFAPPLRAPRDVRAHGSRLRPTACAPLEYKFMKIVVHSTTWASRLSTTVRWMTAGCLGGDHSFLIYSHGPRAHPRTRLYACLI